MAVINHKPTIRPAWPDLDTLPARAELDFDPITDSLLVAFDPTRPAEHFYLDIDGRGYVALRLALDTGEVVGIAVEDLYSVALPRHPTWQRLVEIAGIRAFKAATPADYPAIAAFIADVKALSRL